MTAPIRKKPNKKLHKASQKNSKVVFCNTHESQAMVDLSISVDKLFRHVRNKMGVTIPNKEGLEILHDCHKMIALVSEYTEELAERIEYEYTEP
ncbi:MAG: hypothetical protein U9Q62_07985, partial [Campylobacterota bacterium]|nr:hypothetical protein [Campylobacterota bacterium]